MLGVDEQEITLRDVDFQGIRNRELESLRVHLLDLPSASRVVGVVAVSEAMTPRYKG